MSKLLHLAHQVEQIMILAATIQVCKIYLYDYERSLIN